MDRDMKLEAGKIPLHILEEIIFHNIGRAREEVVLSADIGEDAAAIDLGSELLLVTTDPITGAQEKAGWLAVKVSLNDIAASGGEPICLLVTLLLPENARLSDLCEIVADINEACLEEGVQVAGGHTEVTPGLLQPVISVAALGKTRGRRVLSSADARIGDDIVVTKWAGMEGTSILVRDFRDVFLRVLDEGDIREAEGLFNMISVTKDGKIAAEHDSNACHDATEGGVLGAIYEVCQASGLGAIVYGDEIPVLSVTRKVAEFCHIDPLRLVSSGCLVVTTSKGAELCKAYEDMGIHASVVGAITSGEMKIIRRDGNSPLGPPGPDQLWYARRFLESLSQGQ